MANTEDKTPEEASNLFHNIMKASVKQMKPGDTVYFKDAPMNYERGYVPTAKEKHPEAKAYCSWINPETKEKEEGLFKLSDLSTKPKQ